MLFCKSFTFSTFHFLSIASFFHYFYLCPPFIITHHIFVYPHLSASSLELALPGTCWPLMYQLTWGVWVCYRRDILLVYWYLSNYHSWKESWHFSETLGSPNELVVDENLMIHLDSNRQIPIGSAVTTPPKNLFHVEKAAYGQLKVKLLNPPNLSVSYKPLEVDQRQDLTLYQTYRKGDSYQHEPHR